MTRGRRPRPSQVAILLMAAAAVASTAFAAFEWDHPTPRSLIAGESPARFPVEGRGTGLRVDAIAAHPWSWPDIRAAALRVAGCRRAWVVGLALSQLRGPAYRESRLAAGVERAMAGQRLALTASLLSAATEGGGDPPGPASGRSGIELDLGWAIDGGAVALATRAEGAFKLRGAHELDPPRRLALRLGCGGPLLRSELALEEGTRGRRLGIGMLVRPVPSLEVGGGWSSAEPPLRLLVALSRGGVVLSAGWAWHSVLPPTRLLALSRAASPPSGSAP